MNIIEKLYNMIAGDPETQTYHNNTRHYDPATGDWKPGPEPRHGATPEQLYAEMRRQDRIYGGHHTEDWHIGQNSETDWHNTHRANKEFAKGYATRAQNEAGGYMPDGIHGHVKYQDIGAAHEVDPDEVSQYYADHHHGIQAAGYAADRYWNETHGYK